MAAIPHMTFSNAFSCMKIVVFRFTFYFKLFPGVQLTHWGRVTHKCVGNLTIIGSDNGLSPGRRQAIISTNVGILSIGPLGTNFSEMLIEIHTFSFKKIQFKMSSEKWRPFCVGLNVLTLSHWWRQCLSTEQAIRHYGIKGPVSYSAWIL